VADYYCNRCGAQRGLVRPVPTDLISSTYQLDKFIKHTVLDPTEKLVSTFRSDSTGHYQDLVVSAIDAGSVELDGRGRTNIICRAFKPTGDLFRFGQFVQVQASICVVLTSSTGKIHAFPDNDLRYTGKTCLDCGAPI
jgi:hypothetical protein